MKQFVQMDFKFYNYFPIK